MSRGNVEIVRRGVDAAMRRPKPDWETVNALFAPDHRFVSRFSELEGGSHDGASGFGTWLENAEAMGDWRSTVEDVRAAPDGRVVVIMRFQVSTSHSAVPLEQRMGAVVTVRDGLIQRSEAYLTPRDALEAVGLRE